MGRTVVHSRPTGPSQSMVFQVSDQHSNALRSRVRRFESCWGRFLTSAILLLTCGFADRVPIGLCSRVAPRAPDVAVPGTDAEQGLAGHWRGTTPSRAGLTQG